MLTILSVSPQYLAGIDSYGIFEFVLFVYIMCNVCLVNRYPRSIVIIQHVRIVKHILRYQTAWICHIAILHRVSSNTDLWNAIS